MFPTRIWEFLAGALAAKMHLQKFDIKNKAPKIFFQLLGTFFISLNSLSSVISLYVFNIAFFFPLI